MTDRPPSDTLAAALPREMACVAGLIPTYRQVENGELIAVPMQAPTGRIHEALAKGPQADDPSAKRYANVTPTRSACRQATRTSRISPLCPTIRVNVSGRPLAPRTFSCAPATERSASVQDSRLPLAVRMCAGKLVAKSRLSRRSWDITLSLLLRLKSHEYVDDLRDGRCGIGWCRRRCLLADRNGHALLVAQRDARSYCLQLCSSDHREITICRNADHRLRLHKAYRLCWPVKNALKKVFARTETLISDHWGIC